MQSSKQKQIRQFLVRKVDSGPRLVRLGVAYWMKLWRGNTSVLLRLAKQFQKEQFYKEALHCWKAVRREKPLKYSAVVESMACMIQLGDIEKARRLFWGLYPEINFSRLRLGWVAGEFACHGYREDATRVLLDWTETGIDLNEMARYRPCILSRLIVEEDYADMPRQLRLPSPEEDRGRLQLARFCFAFGNLSTAARLYRQMESERALGVLDEIAMLYAESTYRKPLVEPARLDMLARQTRDDEDAQMTLAHIAMAAGKDELARDLVRMAFRLKYGQASDTKCMGGDIDAIFGILKKLQCQQIFRVPESAFEPADLHFESTVPKLFVCGFGWSGSGAVYDAIRSHGRLCEFEGPGCDGALNEDSDSEATFVQGPAGLGQLWLDAKTDGLIAWQMLWDLFRLHVTGLAPVGYEEYKSAATTANHVRRYGSEYTSIFRKFFEDLAALVGQPRDGDAHALLNRTTEALCQMVSGTSDANTLLFNNAIFGRNVAMLEIFSDYRAVAVYRDPRDIYIDRKSNDKNHWRSPRQMASFYARGLQSYAKHKKNTTTFHADALREISFERFVGDNLFRENIYHWLFQNTSSHDDSLHFDPSVSRHNIGLHKNILDEEEYEALGKSIKAYLKMDRLAALSWGEFRRYQNDRGQV